MVRPQHYVDWHHIVDQPSDGPPTSTRRRLRWILALFGLALAIIFARAVQLELSDGQTFRQLAAQPLERVAPVAAPRGRILARDGTVLAADRQSSALAVEYSYLETPPDREWLRRMARARLPRAERRNGARLLAMEASLCEELSDLHRRLARLCGLSDEQWQARAGRIEREVRRLAAHVNQRRLARHQERAAVESPDGEWSLTSVLAGLFAPPAALPPQPILFAEQTAYHRIVDDVAPQIIADIKKNASAYPGTKIVATTRRDYPLESVAAHLVGHVGARVGATTAIVAVDSGASGDEPAGRMGVERRWESLLRGQPGQERQFTDHRGKRLSATRDREPAPGGDVVLTIDLALQISAEQLLDHCLRRLQPQAGQPSEVVHGGAIVVMDVRSGEILAAGSAPRFDPNAFAVGDAGVEAVLHDPRRPLFDRLTKMAIPPGSVFKPLTALALLESGRLDPKQVFHCQGYLDEPDRLRCQIFRQHGIGHGDVTLADALAQSCNVYFFHHAGELGAAALLDWSGRLGLGRPSGIDLSDEASGQLPTLAQLRQNSQVQAFSIGQGPLTVTPLQIVRMYAAIANGGYLIAPRIMRDGIDGRISRDGDARATALSESDRIAALSPESLDAVREGLRRVVDDPNGTGHDAVRLASLSIAGKTGTAQTGGGQEDHAWFAGYVPAEAPRYAFVVVLEHAGSGATIAGSVAKSLVQRMQQLGYFGAPRTAENLVPPGKG